MLSVREYMEASADHRPLTGEEQEDAVNGVTDLATPAITRAQARIASLRFACPFCHSEAGKRCTYITSKTRAGLVTKKVTKEPHVERLLLVPEWRKREEARKGKSTL